MLIIQEFIYFLNTNAFLLFVLFMRELYNEFFEVCLTLIDAHNTNSEQHAPIETPNYFMTERRQHQSVEYENFVIKLFGTSVDSEFTFVEFVFLDMFGLWEEFGSVFGFTILVWTLFSAPSNFLALFEIITIMQKKASSFLQALGNLFLMISQLILSYQVYSAGDDIKTKVSIKSQLSIWLQKCYD